MADSMYSVTLTGRIRAGRDAPKVWERAASLLKLDASTFHERVLSRLPVTLRSVGYEDAKRQQEALVSCGAEVLLLPEGAAPRVWIRRDRSTRGPLSMAYARHAVRAGTLPGQTQACLQGDKQWQPLDALVRRFAPPAAPPVARPVPAAASPSITPRIRAGLPGWAMALIVVGISVALVGTLAALIAVPAYRGHVIRSQVAQGALLAEHPRTAVASYLDAHRQPPADNAAAGLAAAASIHGPYVDAVVVDHGQVTVHFGVRAAPRVRGRHLRFSPMLREGSVTWTCSSPDLPYAYLPPSCR